MAKKHTKTTGTATAGNGHAASPTAKQGRPSSYNDEVAETICERIANGEPLTKICKDDSMPSYRTLLYWREQHPEFLRMYARAREDCADTMADKICDLAERVERGALDYNAGRVAIDALKWIASKLKPKAYGDRQALEHQGEVEVKPMIDYCPEWLQERIAQNASKASDVN